MSQTKTLTQPLKIGNVYLKHRVVQGPMWSRFCTADGEVTQQMIDYYSARAKGGAALIVIESTAVDSRYGWDMATLRLDEAKMVPGYARLVKQIHLYGIPAVAQLINVGPSSANPISPSGVPSVLHGMVGVINSRAMTLEDIEEQREKFIKTAIFSKEAGCEGVLIHAATSYLLHQFLSPYTNKRTDQYGGNIENRMRLSLEIIEGIRKKCGADFIIGFVLVADELVGQAGLTLEETVKMAKLLEKAGINYLDSMVGMYETFATSERSPGQSKYTRFGSWEYSKAYKNAIKIPVFNRAQGDYDPISWDKHISAGDADVVQLAKPSLCDPDIYNKAVEGKMDDIRECTCSCDCLDGQILWHHQVECELNPDLGKERDYAIKRAEKAKKVLIVGAGPGGLETARVAALRGHDVTVVDREPEAGGKLRYATLCTDNEPLGKFRDWEIKRCKEAGVKFELGKESTPENIQRINPDTVVLAYGAQVRVIPEIPGVKKSHVVSPEDVLTGKVKVGQNVVVIGGNRIGVETAYTLGKKRLAKNVTIVEQQAISSVGYDMETLCMVMMTAVQLPKLGINAMTGTRVEEISDKHVAVVDPEGKKSKIAADTVIVSAGYSNDLGLLNSLEGKVKELYSIGDCVKPRKVKNAVHEGAFVARQI